LRDPRKLLQNCDNPGLRTLKYCPVSTFPQARYPEIIQGGMGAGVSNWRLAHAVSGAGQLGVVSGTGLDLVFSRRLQDGDPGGHMRRALDQFPFPLVAERVWAAYFIEGGKSRQSPYRRLPRFRKDNPRELMELCIVANFAEVFLAREGHEYAVGINYLEKIQLPHLASIYGAMLAGVGYVLMGAGIPIKIPGVLDSFVKHEPASYPLQVTGALDGDDVITSFVPREFMDREFPDLPRPKFLAIVSSHVLAAAILKKANGRVDGFVVEENSAGGHNAPPRGKLQLNDRGEPIYGERDHVDLQKMCALGLPFWLAGGYGSSEGVRAAREAGAAGVQVGTAFAYCSESGLSAEFKQQVLKKVAEGSVEVRTDPKASPTGFPFKVVQLEGTLSEAEACAARPRICDLGYLREAYRTPDGEIDYRCAAEPETVYVSKGGKLEDTIGRKCVCNALMANIGHAQVRSRAYTEFGLITSGDDLGGIARFLPAVGTNYSAADVLSKLMCGTLESRNIRELESTT
jgi:nitronate monooxygenase